MQTGIKSAPHPLSQLSDRRCVILAGGTVTKVDAFRLLSSPQRFRLIQRQSLPRAMHCYVCIVSHTVCIGARRRHGVALYAGGRGREARLG